MQKKLNSSLMPNSMIKLKNKQLSIIKEDKEEVGTQKNVDLSNSLN